jgi:hypothetical protein
MSKKEKSDAELDNVVETQETVGEVTEKTVKRGRGRPKGSKNKSKFQVGNTTPVVAATVGQ